MADKIMKDQVGGLAHLDIGSLEWAEPEDAKKSLQIVYQQVCEATRVTMNWYYEKKNTLKKRAKFIRFAAFTFFALGGLVPIISLRWTEINTQLGYLFLGLASICMMSNQVFGFSSGWIRYIQTHFQLKEEFDKFQCDWALARSQFKIRKIRPN